MKREKRNRLHRSLLTLCRAVLACLMLAACTDDKEEQQASATVFTTYKVAVVMPLDAYSKPRYERTAEWALENIVAAQEGLPRGVKIALEWYDENSEQMEELGNRLVNDKDIVAVIGPYSSVDTYAMANALLRKGKPLITPSASSAQLIRGFSGMGFLWALAESDISQCEVLLAKAYNSGAHRVRLVTSDDIYGETFKDWFAFQAKEMGLTVDDVAIYEPGQCTNVLTQALQGGSDCVIFVPSDRDDVLTAARLRASLPAASPMLMSDMAYDMALPALGDIAEGAEGVCMFASPESGFEVAYQAKFGDGAPTVEEANMYDALMLLAFALREQERTGGYDLNEQLRTIVSAEGTDLIAWDLCGMRLEFEAIDAGKPYNIYGAGGPLDFDKKVYTNVLRSTYINFVVHNGHFVIQGFASTDGSNRTDAALAGWNWKVNHVDSLEHDVNMEYPKLGERWALLVAASTGWSDYRHQADVLHMYQILKSRGYDDDHIVLIMEDDLAYHKANPHPGSVSVSLAGDNLYHDVTIDYHPTQLRPTDIEQILSGKPSVALPQVIRSTAGDNVFVFWSGHGLNGQMVWCDEPEGITTERMKQMAEALHAQGNYRKMGWFVETCFSASVMKSIEGIPGMIALTAADEQETSKADVYNAELKVWMTNRFSSTLTESLTEHPDITLKDLYYRLTTNTIGSHVRLLNQACFGNLNTTTMKEWL